MCIFGKQFTCHSGDCIDIERRCDETMDCDDSSDEIDCRLIDMPTSYLRAQHPPPSEGEKIHIYTHIKITDIHHIDTINMYITLTTKIYMKWKDPRLMFLNPFKDNYKKNIVS